VDRFVKDRDWGRYHNPKDLAIALSVEASELLERFLWRSPPASGLALEDPEGVADELADVLIYGLHLANATGLDVSDIVSRKITKNEAKHPVGRPPRWIP